MKSSFSKLLLLSAVMLGIAASLYFADQQDIALLQSWIGDAGVGSGLLFVALYAVGTLFFFPGSVLTLAGGAIFGPVLGTLYNLTGATLGAMLAFLLSRYLAAEWVEPKVGGRLKQLKQGVENEGWRFVAFVRLVPLFPFNALNYALGLTRVKLLHYVLASFVCMLPGALAYSYLGYASREAISGSDGVLQEGLLALALLAIVMFVPRFIKRLKQQSMISVQELKARQDDNTQLLVVDVRSADEFCGEQGHIPGAHNIPLPELDGRLAELGSDLATPVVLICHTDRRSAKAAGLLAKLGFSNLSVVQGGMVQWRAQAYPVHY